MPTVTWSNPTPNARQRPLASVDVGMRVVGAPSFDTVGNVPAPGSSFPIDPTLAVGDYEFTVQEIDDKGGRSQNNPIVAYSVAADDPSPASGLAVTP